MLKDNPKFQKASFWKRLLYLLCFIGINLIEFTKATQTGDVWYVSVNLTGLAVFLMIASTFSRHEIWNLRTLLISVFGVALMIGAFCFKQTSDLYIHLGQVESALLNVWWIGIVGGVLGRRLWKSREKKIHFDLKGIVWILMMLCMTLSVNERLWPLWFLGMFGAFYLTDFTSEERKLLLDSMIDGTVLCFFAFQIYAYGTRPYDTVRYVGFYDNSNTLALYYLTVYTMILCKLHILHFRYEFCETKKEKWAGRLWKLFYFIGAGGLLSFQIFTLCRTAWIVSCVVTLIYGLLAVHRAQGVTFFRTLLRGVALGLMVVVTFLPVFLTIRWLPTLTHYRVWYSDEYSVDKVHSFDPPNSWKYVELDEFMDEFLGRIINTLKRASAEDPLALKAQAQEFEDVDLVEVSWTEDASIRVRLTIYKTYLENMTWVGNPSNKGFYKIGGIYDCLHAQNLWIQMGYSFGIPAGILSVLLTVLVLCNHGKGVKDNRKDPYAIIPLMICVVFFMFGITEVVWLPGQMILFLMFFVQHPQVAYDTTAQDGEE